MALDNISEMTLEECEKKLDELLDSDDAEDEDIIALYTAMGDKAKEEGEFEKSKEYYMNALTETLMKYGESSIEAGDAAMNAGNGLFNTSDYEAALEYYTKALETFEETSPDDCDRMTVAMRSIGDCHFYSENYEEAVSCFTAAMDFLKTKKSEDDPEFYRLYSVMAETLSKMEKFEEALGYYKKGFDIKRKFVESDMDLMEDYEGIGKCCEKLGKNEEGIEAFSKIVKAIKETMPEMDFLAKEFQSHVDAMKDAISKQ